MGQTIEVKSTRIGDVALFDTDRSLTGQDSHSFTGTSESDDPPALLANRLFASDPSVLHVHVLSNTVSIERDGGWDDASLAAARSVIAGLFIFYGEPADPYDALRDENYNATISHIRAHNEELWVMKVKPDNVIEGFVPGQYTTLALGYWEHRADDAEEEVDEDQRRKLARRSYSVSCSIVDRDTGELVAAEPGDVEFYVVKVPPGKEGTPALTPRIFTRREGDRIFMGRKFTGRYTLEGVEPDDKVVFLSTGTGEAPQNAMTAELLRTGHRGPILNLVCVRYRDDLAYLPEQEIVQQKWENYRYEVLTTREPENLDNKVYIQDLVREGKLEEMLGAPLDPVDTHVFLCGNPAMIGLPQWEDDTPIFPEPEGVCQLLHERGFTIDHLKTKGNVHYEEYWTEN
ncbi:MAG: ferredoxin--NADP reductase [Acidimicrobiia bacterium]